MDFLKSLSDIGLPGWFIIAAASVFILHKIGALGWLNEALRDSQEFSQQQESEAKKFERLQQSWQADRLFGMFDENLAFFREQVWKELEEIHTQVRRTEMTIARQADILSLLTREVSEIVEAKRKNSDE